MTQPRHRCPTCGLYVAQRGSPFPVPGDGTSAIKLMAKLYEHVDPRSQPGRAYDNYCNVREIEVTP